MYVRCHSYRIEGRHGPNIYEQAGKYGSTIPDAQIRPSMNVKFIYRSLQVERGRVRCDGARVDKVHNTD